MVLLLSLALRASNMISEEVIFADSLDLSTAELTSDGYR
jgi:hypothetical protein